MFVLAFAESIQLFPDGTIFVHIGLILLMIWVLNRTLFRPINQIMATRERSKGGRGGEAAEILADVREKEAKYSRELLEARTEGYELIEKEHKRSAAAREKTIAAAKAEASAFLETGRTQLEQQSVDARASIIKDAEKNSDNIVSNILKA
jgi:F-type H+-transporting ATPase subunit b